jgi:hypothetical protein
MTILNSGSLMKSVGMNSGLEDEEEYVQNAEAVE